VVWSAKGGEREDKRREGKGEGREGREESRYLSAFPALAEKDRT